MPQPLGNGQPLQLMRAFRAGATFSTATTGTIATPTGATYLQKIVFSITEEARQAYKDIEGVLANELDLAIPFKQLKTLGVIKG